MLLDYLSVVSGIYSFVYIVDVFYTNNITAVTDITSAAAITDVGNIDSNNSSDAISSSALVHH